MTNPLVEGPFGEPGLPREPKPWDESLDGPEPDEPSDAELAGAWPDPFAGSPDDADEWLARQWHAGDGDEVGAAAGFAAGGALDAMAPDPALAGFVADASDTGLGVLSDDELVGLLCAARRLSSWQAAVELRAVAELDQRRRARSAHPGSSRTSEHVNDELAAALTMTGRSADALLTLSRDLARLPMVLAALAAGVIDRAKAAVFGAELAALTDVQACAIAAALWRPAARLTTSQLRAQLRALVLMADPDAARRRREKARDEARVELWQEGSGNSGLAGRELPAAEVIAADKRVTAIARALRKAGAHGTMDQLRAAVFTALLTGQDPMALIPASTGQEGQEGQDRRAAVPAITGTLHLTMPLSAWAGWTDSPGEIAGLGPADADTCRDLAARLAASPATRWCLTLTDSDGVAAGHACATSGPSKDPPAWLRSLKISWLERGACAHRRQSRGYRPSPRLAHLTQIRQRTCASPGCRRPAEACDLDHTVPYHQGGRTCECNLGPLCRRHHQCKQAPGWRLAQPQPGYLVWTAPHGRSYTVTPGRYLF